MSGRQKETRMIRSTTAIVNDIIIIIVITVYY